MVIDLVGSAAIQFVYAFYHSVGVTKVHDSVACKGTSAPRCGARWEVVGFLRCEGHRFASEGQALKSVPAADEEEWWSQSLKGDGHEGPVAAKRSCWLASGARRAVSNLVTRLSSQLFAKWRRARRCTAFSGVSIGTLEPIKHACHAGKRSCSFAHVLQSASTHTHELMTASVCARLHARARTSSWVFRYSPRLEGTHVRAGPHPAPRAHVPVRMGVPVVHRCVYI
eukprot:6183435-Pleurochrysis_carterae.AAC.2